MIILTIVQGKYTVRSHDASKSHWLTGKIQSFWLDIVWVYNVSYLFPPASSTYHHINETETQNIVATFTACQCWLIGQFRECSISNPNFIGFEETSRYWSAQFFLCFSLLTINPQTSYDSGIIQQDFRII